jgi:5-oxoprolinase (ATP-hydrolysing) subunit A
MEVIIDLNADVGEGAGDDESLISSGITSVNVACGAHAGDDETMRLSCSIARRHGVALGAHPGYMDRRHFGRRPLLLPKEEIRASVNAQLWRLMRHATAAGLGLVHVKPHGALYHQGNSDPVIAESFMAAMQMVTPNALLFGPPAGAWREMARHRGIRFVAEGFIDRRYRPDGTLVPRGSPDAVVTDEEEAIRQAISLARAGRVQTLCVHGDGAEPLRLLAAARRALAAEGFRFYPPR